jgi:hypothetical protein
LTPEPRDDFDPDERESWEETPHGAEGRQPDGLDDFGDRPGVVFLSDVVSERVDWLWPGRIPLGKLTVLEGDPKTGKSTAAIDFAARVSTGSPFPDGARLSGPGVVILMSAEDGLADTIRPRLDAAGADPSKVMAWESMPVLNDEGVASSVRSPSLPRDLDALRDLIVGHGAVLVIVDVLAAYLGSDVDGHRDQDVRRALMPLAKLAERTHTAILVLRHLNKSGGGPAIYRGGGSIGIAGAARSVLLAAVDPLDESGNRRVLAVTGCNVAAPAPALAYHLAPSEEHGCAQVVWDGHSDHTSSTLLATQIGDEDRSAVDEAGDFLRDILDNGPVAARDVDKAARDAGVQPRTLRRAKERLKIRSVKSGMGASWSWVLPVGEGDRDQGGPTPEDGHLGLLRGDQDVCSGQGGQGSQGQGLDLFGAPPLDEVEVVI